MCKIKSQIKKEVQEWLMRLLTTTIMVNTK